MKKPQKCFKVKVWKIVRSDIENRSRKELIYEGERWAVSTKQAAARMRHSNNWYDHDERYGSVSVEYVFEFETQNEEIKETQEKEEDNSEDDERTRYTEYGCIVDGIERATDSNDEL